MSVAPETCDLVVFNATILTVDHVNTILEDGAIAVRDGRIVAIDRSRAIRQAYAAETVFDAKGGVVHPGFIDAHIHVSQYTSRTVLPRMEGTEVTMGHWKAALTPDDEYASAALATVDYLRSGYTGFVDPGTIFEPDAVAHAVDKTGFRAWLTDPYVADVTEALAADEPDLVSRSFLDRWPKTLDEALSRIGGQLRRNQDLRSRVRAFVGLYGESTASDALRAAAIQIARGHGVQYQEHKGYNPTTYRNMEVLEGRRHLRGLYEAGYLARDTTYIHMNVVHSEDVAILVESQASLVWCPYAQMRAMGAGPAEPRMVELSRSGGRVALATDIPRTVSFDALGSLAMANSAVCGLIATGPEVLRMRTIGAAASVGADAWVGSLETGKSADFVVRSHQSSEPLGLDASSEIAVLGLSSPPALTVIQGAIVLKDGDPVNVDAFATLDAARRSVSRLMRETGLSR